MKTSDVTWRLAELASKTYQERYVIGGTAQEYVLAVELLENVDALRYLIDRPENQVALTDAQASAIRDLLANVAELSEAALGAGSPEEQSALIRDSGTWKTLRAKAGAALRTFGLSPDMSLEEIEALREPA